VADYRIDWTSVNNPNAPDLDTVIESLQNAVASGNSGEVVYVENYTGTASQKIQAAIDYAASTSKKTVILADKDYYITSTITVKVGVKLRGGHGSSITVGADVRGIVVERNAALRDIKINVDYSGYSKEVLYFDGSQHYYNTWNRTFILNWTGVVSGTAIKLYAGATNDEISFLDFINIKIVSFSKGVYLKAVQPATGVAYINANRFLNFSIEDCVDMILLESAETVPNECSGNMFKNLQIQPTATTQRIFTITGQYNKIEGILWDESNIAGGGVIAKCNTTSNYNDIDMKSIPLARYSNLGGSSNKFAQ
jgi:hypothetical protein